MALFAETAGLGVDWFDVSDFLSCMVCGLLNCWCCASVL